MTTGLLKENESPVPSKWREDALWRTENDTKDKNTALSEEESRRKTADFLKQFSGIWSDETAPPRGCFLSDIIFDRCHAFAPNNYL